MRCITCVNYYLQTDFNLPRAEEAPPARGIGGGRSLTTSVGKEICRRNPEGDDSGRPRHCAL